MIHSGAAMSISLKGVQEKKNKEKRIKDEQISHHNTQLPDATLLVGNFHTPPPQLQCATMDDLLKLKMDKICKIVFTQYGHLIGILAKIAKT